MTRENVLLTIGLLFLAVLFVLLMALLVAMPDTFKVECEAAGNLVLEDTDVNLGLDTNFDLTFTSETDRFCVTPNGNIVDID